MHRRNHYKAFFLVFLLLFGCSEKETKNRKAEYIYRKNDWVFYSPLPQTKKALPQYAWDRKYCGSFPCITKEFFRCRGNSLNPAVTKQNEGSKEHTIFRDCMGSDHHGLPLREGEEFIYPCLLDLLNYVQEKTHKRVVITTGHRCPEHNTFCDPSPSNFGSKHMIGAEVDFYVEGMENQPQVVIEHIIAYYKEHFPGQKAYEKFERSDKKLNVVTPPWINKEIFVKLYLPHEGRDADNQHPYPYIGMQVRFDRDRSEPVRFDTKVSRNYLRY